MPRPIVPTPDIGGHHAALPSTPGATEHGQGIAWDNDVGAFAWATMGGGGSSDHATLSHLDWPSSGHTGTADTAPAFGPAGAAAEISGAPGQVLGWDTAGHLAALTIVLACMVMPPTWGLPMGPIVAYPCPVTWADGLVWS